MKETIRILPCGDSALTLVLGDEVSEAVHRRVKAMELALRRAALPGVLELVPTYTTVCIHYDPCLILCSQLEAAILSLTFAPEAVENAGRLVEIPVCYGGAYGPDLETVAAHAGLLPEEVIRRNIASICWAFCPALLIWAGWMRLSPAPGCKRPAPGSRQAPWASRDRRRASIRWSRPAAGSSSGARRKRFFP